MEGVADLEGVLDSEVKLVHAQLFGEDVHLAFVDQGGVDAGYTPDGYGTAAIGAGLAGLDADVRDSVRTGEEVDVSTHTVVNLLPWMVAPVSAIDEDLGVDRDEFSILGCAGSAVHVKAEPLGRAQQRFLPAEDQPHRLSVLCTSRANTPTSM